MRINFNMSDELLRRVDEYAKEMSLNRSAALSVLVTSALNDIEDKRTLRDGISMLQDEEMQKAFLLSLKDKKGK